MSKSKEKISNLEIRLDKWLWAARFYKTRSIAQSMINGGKVHYNNNRVKPSRTVEINAIIKLRQGSDKKIIQVLALSEKRGNATTAQLLYKETPNSIEERLKNTQLRKLNALYMPSPNKRPDKKQRRELLKLKQHQNNLGD